MIQTLELNHYDEKLQPIMASILKTIERGLDSSTSRKRLELKRIELERNDDYSADDLKLVFLCIESCDYLHSTDLKDYLWFTGVMFHWEDQMDYHYTLGHLFDELQKTLDNKQFLSRDAYLSHMDTQPDHNSYLRREEIDRLLAKVEAAEAEGKNSNVDPVDVEERYSENEYSDTYFFISRVEPIDPD